MDALPGRGATLGDHRDRGTRLGRRVCRVGEERKVTNRQHKQSQMEDSCIRTGLPRAPQVGDYCLVDSGPKYQLALFESAISDKVCTMSLQL